MNDAGLLAAIRALGLIAPNEAAKFRPMTGGVSSDVFLVQSAAGPDLIVKRSIPKLRVEADWRAPVARDAQEVAWLRTVREIDPHLAPEVLAWSPEQHLFVMERRSGAVWKQAMAEGRIDPGLAGQAGRALSRVHTATTARVVIAARFPDPSNFAALRIDPFILYTAERHPDVAARLKALAADLQSRRTALIWGDASPKNILVAADGPVFLDAETATMGDPAFDLAFCLAHLLLKTVWLAPQTPALLASFAALRDAYLAGFEADASFGTRAASLIGALLLARVDGKSPAGYLDADQDEIVRRRAKWMLAHPNLDLAGLPGFWRTLA